MKLHLLEPYRSAIIAQAIKEGFIRCVPEEAASQSNALRATGTPELISQTLQLAVLHDDISIVWSEVDNKKRWEELRIAYMTDSGLQNLGALKLLPHPDQPGWQDAGDNVRDWWALEKDSTDAYKELILSQLEARGRHIHWAIFRLLRAVRLGEEHAVPLIASVIPPQYERLAQSIIENPSQVIDLDFSIMATLDELKAAFSLAETSQCKVGGAALEAEREMGSTGLGRSASQIWAIVVDKLVEEEIHFPTPERLSDVLSLRESKEIIDFRNLLFPFIDSFTDGDFELIQKLRKEVASAAKAFRRFPKIRKLGSYVGYASIGIGVIEAVTGLVGPSIGAGLITLGLEGLAKRWEKRGSWLYLSNYSGKRH